jgi:serine protease Do
MRLHLLLTATVLVCAAGLLVPVPSRAGEPAVSFNPRRTPVVDVVKRTKDAVVNIHSERTVPAPADGREGAAPSRVNGMGTGIIIDPRGYIITNQHVVEDVNVLRVRLSDGTSTSAKVIARDAETDLALLKIEVTKPLPTIPLGTSQDLMVGETVVAIGNAYGYEHTVSKGIVSALKRDVSLNKEISYKSLIQTDAAINPGNSGGPLLNINGELIGVNVAIRAGAQGIGFAIPVDNMLRVAAELMSVRKRSGTWHGLVGRDEVVLSEEGEEPAGGAIKNAVAKKVTGTERHLIVDRAEAGSPAAKAGLQQGDLVTEANGKVIVCALDLERALIAVQVGDKVSLVVKRKDAEQKLELVMASAERSTAVGNDQVWKKLGLKLQTTAPESVSRVNPQLHGGLTVTDVRAESAAAKAGLQRGDILVGLHTWEMLTMDNVTFVLNHNDLPTFNPLKFYIIRAGQVHRGWLQQVE